MQKGIIRRQRQVEFAAPAQPVVESPSTIKHLALFALELEERGFELEPDEE